MKNFGVVALVVVLGMTTPVYAQMQGEPGQSGMTTLGESEASQDWAVVMGRITELDLARGTVTLDNGMEFALPLSFQFTSFPAIGQEVVVSYVEEGGRPTVRSIEIGGMRED